MYDNDDKLVAADEYEIRLWDFNDYKEEAPSMLSSMTAPFKMDHVFVFHVCKQNKKSPNYVMITNGGKFQVYEGRLELSFEGEVTGELAGVTVESADYWMGEKSAKIMIGTSDGRLITYDMETKTIEADVRIGGVT
jgi:hypothetical protein